MSAKLTATRRFWLGGRLVEIGETIESDDANAAELLGSGKAAAADDATRRRVQFKNLSDWSEPASCESFRREWDLRNLVAENRARK